MADWCNIAEESALLDDNFELAVGGSSQSAVELAVLDDAIVEGAAAIAFESAVLDDAVELAATKVTLVTDDLVIDDLATSPVVDDVVEAAVLDDALSAPVLDYAFEAAILDDATALQTAAVNLVVEAAVLNDAVSGTELVDDAVEAAVLDDAVRDGGAYSDLAIEAAVLDDLTNGLVPDRIVEAFLIDDALAQSAEVSDNAPEVIYISDAVFSGGGQAWRTNTDNFPMSRYTNQPFNSLASLGGQLLMASDTGLYRMAGDEDHDGAQIDAVIEHDLTDRLVQRDGKMASSPMIKRPRYAYLGYKSSGALKFRLGYIGDTAEQSAMYDFPASRASQLVNGRVALGRGIRSRWMRPAILNDEGSDFTLNDGTMIVDEIERRL